MKAIVFGTTKCVWCDRVSVMLKDAKIEVDKIDISESKDNLKQMKAYVGKTKMNTVPQVVIDNEFIGGYTEVERFINHLPKE
jgi:glutaredoxin